MSRKSCRPSSRVTRALPISYFRWSTTQATALVHEAYLKLVESKAQQWNSRGHFFAAAAEAMRRILVDRARKKHSVKHGGGQLRQPLDLALVMAPEVLPGR